MSISYFPFGHGVPGDNEAPNWYDNSAAPPRDYNGSPEDPRWRGAFGHSFGDGAGVHVSFRGLHTTESGAKWLLLSWIINVGTAEIPPSSTPDKLCVGFSSVTGSPANVIVITLNTDIPTSEPSAFASGAYTVQLWTSSSGAWTQESLAPTWTHARTRVWVSDPPTSVWAAQMALHLNPTGAPEDPPVYLDAADKFNMWYVVYLGTPEFENGEFVYGYRWPSTNGVVGFGDPLDFPDAFPNPTDFPDCSISNIVVNSVPGISIKALDIGTENPDDPNDPAWSSSRIYVDPGTPRVAGTYDKKNRFFARPTFTPNTLGAYPVARREAVRARFRLANWGSTVGELTPDSWTDVPRLRETDPPADIEAAKYISYQPELPLPPPPAPPEGTCWFDWPEDADLPPTAAGSTSAKELIDNMIATLNSLASGQGVPAGGRTTHHCMLVELDSVHAGGETFINNSVYRNMRFVDASRFESEAEISVKGLVPIDAKNPNRPRDVYLYVDIRNMPSYLTKLPEVPEWLGVLGHLLVKLYEWLNDGQIGILTDRAVASEQGEAANTGDKEPNWSDVDERARHTPTYRVYVYHDTGRETRLFGEGSRRILRAQTSFGYFVKHGDEHSDPRYGWRHWLAGAERIGPNFYRIAVPHNGVAKVTTGIQAFDRRGCAWIWGVFVELIKRLFGRR